LSKDVVTIGGLTRTVVPESRSSH